MFRHLLVPLDGSGLAEAVLPPAAALAERLGASLTLLHVMERDAPATIHGERHLTDEGDAERYLAEVQRRLALGDRPVARHVHEAKEGDVALAIVQHAAELRVDLIVLCTHGRGGLRELVVGSIAQRVLQRGAAPIFLVHPAGGAPPPFACRTILVPLDGTAAHEPALNAALELARAFQARLHLVIVVPTPGTLSGGTAAAGTMMPLATNALLDLATEGAAEYMRRQVERLRAGGLEASAEVRRGEPAANLVEAAERAGADVIVMASHGRAGLEAFWEGSVSAKVVARFGRPVLLVRASDTPPPA
ncbi:MAG TPA: universal stress protein [Candidatus Methylomirabilis sp.]